jgi:hypothetical protein
MNPRYPLYVVSKGRWESRLTSKSLERMRVPYFVVIEQQEFDHYAAVIDRSKLLVLDTKYQDEYETCDALGATKSKGPGAARNFAWDHSLSLGAAWHWVMDDNILKFCRFNDNLKVEVSDGAFFRAQEDFVERYSNIAMAGPNYWMFVPRKKGASLPPFILNTRIYSCNLIRNDTPFRWRGRYNEDTDLSLRMLKDGWCTVQFNAFIQDKIRTQALKGGNTAEFYAREGTLPKSEMQVRLHPDISRLTRRFGRWHHYVDYSRFQTNTLRKKPNQVFSPVNDYGMRLVAHAPKSEMAFSEMPTVE